MNMEAPGFWDDPETSNKQMKELKNLKDTVDTYHELETAMEDIETLIQMGYEENDESLIPEIREELDAFIAKFDEIRVSTLLSDEYDHHNAILKLNAGAGRYRELRLGEHAVPYVHPVGRAQGLYRGSIGLSGR